MRACMCAEESSDMNYFVMHLVEVFFEYFEFLPEGFYLVKQDLDGTVVDFVVLPILCGMD